MTQVTRDGSLTHLNPINFIEDNLLMDFWEYERLSAHELLVEIPGRWSHYDMQFTWVEEADILHIYCIFPFQYRSTQWQTLASLLTLLNQRIALGHFEDISQEREISYRYTLSLLDRSVPSQELMQELIEIALGECERFFPAFQFVLSGDKTPQEALDAALLDVAGEA